MAINIEYEDRVMLNKKQYKLLKKDLSKIKQKKKLEITNFYFDDKSISLLSSHVVLRVRRSNSDYELTLKVKGANGDKEINQSLSKQEAKKIIKGQPIPNGEVKEELNKMKNIESLSLVTSLKTKRIEYKIDNSLLVLDKNKFSNIIDYNLECESSTKSEAKKIIQEYCNKYAINYSKDYISKSRRAINKVVTQHYPEHVHN